MSFDDVQFSEYSLDAEQLDAVELTLYGDLIRSGVHSVLLVDMGGNIIAKSDDGSCEHDLYSLAALSSANFAAVDTMAQILGEQEFSLLFHKGEKESIHFSKVMEDFLLITIFGKDTSLGLLRIKIEEATEKLKELFASVESVSAASGS